MKSDTAKAIVKRFNELVDGEKKIKKAKSLLVCKCPHRRADGAAELVRVKGENGGPGKYICKICRKDIDINGTNIASVESAVKVLDSALDALKFGISPDGDSDLLEKICKAQHRNLYVILPAYIQMINNKNKRRDSGRDNYSGSTTWGAPSRG